MTQQEPRSVAPRDVTPKLSVVVPVLNDARGLDSTLRSLGPDHNLEIVVIDGGSTDGTLKIIQQSQRRITVWESGKDSGIADAMNRGIRQTTGSHIAILNAGDNWFSSTSARVTEAIEQNPGYDVYHGTLEFADAEGNTHRVKPNLSKLHQRMYLFHPTLFVDRRCYDRLGLYDTSYALAMDSEWCHRAVAQGASFFEIPETLARMALGGRSDLRYADALREYRRSVVQHGLASPARAYFYYLLVLAGKFLKSTLRMPGSVLQRLRGRQTG